MQTLSHNDTVYCSIQHPPVCLSGLGLMYHLGRPLCVCYWGLLLDSGIIRSLWQIRSLTHSW